MNSYQAKNAVIGIHKGDMIATEVYDNVVVMWFRSPTGDSSDSYQYRMECRDNRQATEIANRHNKVWGINYIHLDVIAEEEPQYEEDLSII